jgi:hypothetical protein
MMIATGYECDNHCDAIIGHNALGSWVIVLYGGQWYHLCSLNCCEQWTRYVMREPPDWLEPKGR